jgi:hypothetical protein
MGDADSPRRMSSMLWRVLVAALLLVPPAAFVVRDLTSHDEPRPPRPAVILPADAERTSSPGGTPRGGKPDRPGKPGGGPEDPKNTPRTPETDDDCDDDETTVRPCPDDVDDDGEDDDAGSDDGDDG